jgi:hypothetical protein
MLIDYVVDSTQFVPSIAAVHWERKNQVKLEYTMMMLSCEPTQISD